MIPKRLRSIFTLVILLALQVDPSWACNVQYLSTADAKFVIPNLFTDTFTCQTVPSPRGYYAGPRDMAHRITSFIFRQNRALRTTALGVRALSPHETVGFLIQHILDWTPTLSRRQLGKLGLGAAVLGSGGALLAQSPSAPTSDRSSAQSAIKDLFDLQMRSGAETRLLKAAENEAVRTEILTVLFREVERHRLQPADRAQPDEFVYFQHLLNQVLSIDKASKSLTEVWEKGLDTPVRVQALKRPEITNPNIVEDDTLLIRAINESTTSDLAREVLARVAQNNGARKSYVVGLLIAAFRAAKARGDVQGSQNYLQVLRDARIASTFELFFHLNYVTEDMQEPLLNILASRSDVESASQGWDNWKGIDRLLERPATQQIALAVMAQLPLNSPLEAGNVLTHYLLLRQKAHAQNNPGFEGMLDRAIELLLARSDGLSILVAALGQNDPRVSPELIHLLAQNTDSALSALTLAPEQVSVLRNALFDRTTYQESKRILEKVITDLADKPISRNQLEEASQLAPVFEEYELTLQRLLSDPAASRDWDRRIEALPSGPIKDRLMNNRERFGDVRDLAITFLMRRLTSNPSDQERLIILEALAAWALLGSSFKLTPAAMHIILAALLSQPTRATAAAILSTVDFPGGAGIGPEIGRAILTVAQYGPIALNNTSIREYMRKEVQKRSDGNVLNGLGVHIIFENNPYLQREALLQVATTPGLLNEFFAQHIPVSLEHLLEKLPLSDEEVSIILKADSDRTNQNSLIVARADGQKSLLIRNANIGDLVGILINKYLNRDSLIAIYMEEPGDDGLRTEALRILAEQTDLSELLRKDVPLVTRLVKDLHNPDRMTAVVKLLSNIKDPEAKHLLQEALLLEDPASVIATKNPQLPVMLLQEATDRAVVLKSIEVMASFPNLSAAQIDAKGVQELLMAIYDVNNREGALNALQRVGLADARLRWRIVETILSDRWQAELSGDIQLQDRLTVWLNAERAKPNGDEVFKEIFNESLDYRIRITALSIINPQVRKPLAMRADPKSRRDFWRSSVVALLALAANLPVLRGLGEWDALFSPHVSHAALIFGIAPHLSWPATIALSFFASILLIYVTHHLGEPTDDSKFLAAA